MGETSTSSAFPRRDERGHIARVTDLLGTALAGVVIGVLVLVVFDGLFHLIGSGTFGGANGWLALVLPAWLFVEEFRSWTGPARWVAALTAAAIALAAGLLVAGIAARLELPALASGAAAAVTFALAYSVIWFHGVRWLDRRIAR
jgi:hypothetical protein